jgi:hypothetical protein
MQGKKEKNNILFAWTTNRLFLAKDQPAILMEE